METKTLGKRINTARKEKKMTSEQLSEACHINATYLRQIESGAKTPSLPVFIDLCNELEVSPNYLLFDLIEHKPSQGDNLIDDLYQKANPNQIKLITAMLSTALENI